MTDQVILGCAEELAGLRDDRILADGTSVGSWRILALIGKGGEGEIYRVEHVKSGTLGALKVPLSDDRHLRSRFELELEILQAVASSPATVSLHFPRLVDKGISSEGEVSYFVVELLQELDLPKRSSEIKKLVIEVCEAVRELHRKGYLHRDIKPRNLMRRENGEVVLIDFGLACRIKNVANPISDRISMTKGLVLGVGSEGWSAPEQLHGHASVRSDVYALGSLASHCFGGKTPAVWIPVIQKAHEANPDYRYADVAEFESAVRKGGSLFEWIKHIKAWRIILVVAALTVVVPSFFATRDGKEDMGRKDNNIERTTRPNEGHLPPGKEPGRMFPDSEIYQIGTLLQKDQFELAVGLFSAHINTNMSQRDVECAMPLLKSFVEKLPGGASPLSVQKFVIPNAEVAYDEAISTDAQVGQLRIPPKWMKKLAQFPGVAWTNDAQRLYVHNHYLGQTELMSSDRSKRVLARFDSMETIVGELEGVVSSLDGKGVLGRSIYKVKESCSELVESIKMKRRRFLSYEVVSPYLYEAYCSLFVGIADKKRYEFISSLDYYARDTVENCKEKGVKLLATACCNGWIESCTQDVQKQFLEVRQLMMKSGMGKMEDYKNVMRVHVPMN